MKIGTERNKDKLKKIFLISVNPSVFVKFTKDKVLYANDIEAIKAWVADKVSKE